MDENNQKAAKELLKSLNYIANENKKSETKVYDGVVISKASGNKWNVQYNGENHAVRQYGADEVPIGQLVKVFIPQGSQGASWFIAPSVRQPVDTIVEEGQTGQWRYRKWSSGKAECWGNLGNTGDVTEVWGNTFLGLYENNFLEYPFAFKETPTEIATLHSNYGGLLYQQQINSTTRSGTYGILRGASATGVSIYIDIYIFGQWK